MNDKEPEYINADLARMSEEQFSDAAGSIPVPSSFDDALEWALLLCSQEAKNARHMDGQQHIHLSNYDGAWCVNADRVGGGEISFLKGGEDSGLQAGPKITGPINMKILNFVGMPSLQRWSTVDPKDRRGYTGAMNHVVRHRLSFYMDKLSSWYGLEDWWTFNEIHNDKGGYTIDPRLMPKLPGTYIDPLDVKKYMADAEAQQMRRTVQFAFNMALTANYEWFVYVKEVHGGIGVKFAIDPSAAKEVFAMRNDDTSARKRALVHIVKGHQRNMGTSEEERITWVRRHLRGETKFMHKGAELHIIPSASDIAMTKTRKKFLAV